MNPASSDFIQSAEESHHRLVHRETVQSENDGRGDLASYSLGMWTRYERSRPSTFKLRVWSPGFNIGGAVKSAATRRDAAVTELLLLNSRNTAPSLVLSINGPRFRLLQGRFPSGIMNPCGMGSSAHCIFEPL